MSPLPGLTPEDPMGCPLKTLWVARPLPIHPHASSSPALVPCRCGNTYAPNHISNSSLLQMPSMFSTSDFLRLPPEQPPVPALKSAL